MDKENNKRALVGLLIVAVFGIAGISLIHRFYSTDISPQTLTGSVISPPSISFTGGWETTDALIGGVNNWEDFSPDPTDTKFAAKDNPDHRWQIDSTIFRQGLHSLRIQLQPGDLTSNGNNRAELVGMLDGNGNEILENLSSGTKYYALSVRLDPNWIPPLETDCATACPKGTGHSIHGTIVQLHKSGTDKDTDTGPAIALQVVDRFYITIYARDIGTSQKTLPNNGVYEISNNALNPGQWIDFVMKVVYAKDTTGSVTLWRRDQGQADFTQVLDATNLPTLFSDPNNGGVVKGHAWHVGYYRAPQTTITNTLWIDGMARGDNFDDVVNEAFPNPIINTPPEETAHHSSGGGGGSRGSSSSSSSSANTSTPVVGCNPGDLYSPLTGQLCPVSTAIPPTTATVTATLLNVRAAPVTGTVLTTIPRNTVVTVGTTTTVGTSTWMSVTLANSTTGWAYSPYVHINGTTTGATQAIVKAAQLNVRSTPNYGPIIGQVYAGATGTVVAGTAVGTWVKVQFQSITGYVYLPYVTIQ